MTAHDIIIRPVITEKSMAGIAEKKYTFQVAMGATKIDVKNAVTELFRKDEKDTFQVVKVNIMHVRGHLRRQGRSQGYTPSWKKAIVTLSEDSKPIEFFEGMM